MDYFSRNGLGMKKLRKCGSLNLIMERNMICMIISLSGEV